MRRERVAGHPAVRVGGGGGDREPPDAGALVVIPGLNDPLLRAGEHRWADPVYARFCRRYARDRRVYFVSRPPGLPDDLSVAALAEGYRRVLSEVGPAAVMGLSMGGFVVQRLAADSPDLVEKAVLGLCADRLSPGGRRIVERWCGHARAGRWGRIYAEAARIVADPPLAWGFALAGLAYTVVSRGPVRPDDFRRTARATLDYDGRAVLRRIDVPTLTVGGTADPFFDPADYRRTARALGGESVRLMGVGHETVVEHADRFDGPVERFLG